jgi:hypothetical protein
MKDLSLHIIDILQNSTRAEATEVTLSIYENLQEDILSIQIEDNGKGMSEEIIIKVIDPFYTTRTTRKVGMGLPLLKQNAELTGGLLKIESEIGVGTTVFVSFGLSHIDRPELGDMPQTIKTFIAGNPEVKFSYKHMVGSNEFELKTEEIKDILDGIPINNLKVLKYIEELVFENLKELKK